MGLLWLNCLPKVIIAVNSDHRMFVTLPQIKNKTAQ